MNLNNPRREADRVVMMGIGVKTGVGGAWLATFLLAGFVFSWAPLAKAKYSPGTRLSENVEDRRLSGHGITVIVKMAPLARAGENPFRCPALKELRPLAAELGEKLKSIPTNGELFASYEQEAAGLAKGSSAASAVSGTVNACEGAKRAQLQMLSVLLRSLVASRNKHINIHDPTWRMANDLTEKILEAEKAPTAGDRINDKISHCPKWRRQYKDALFQYHDEIVSVLDRLDERAKATRAQIEQARAIRCGS